MNTSPLLRRAGLLGAPFAAGLMVHTADGSVKDWQNPRLTGVNLQRPHATMVVCPDERTALSIGAVSNAERVKSPFYRSLNGPWKYRYGRNHTERSELPVQRTRLTRPPTAPHRLRCLR